MIPKDILLDLSQSGEKRIQAIFQLLKYQTPESIDVLIYALFNDPSPIVRHECAYVLGEMRSTDLIKNMDKGATALINAMQKDKNRFVVHEAALAVANLGDPWAKECLEELLKSEDPDLVETAEISLQRLDMKINYKIIDHINPIIGIFDLTLPKEYRIQFAFKLLDDGSNSSVDGLIKAMHQETSPIVKHEIIFALGETASSMVVPELFLVLQTDNNLFVVHEAALALGTLGDIRAKEVLYELLNHSEEVIKESAEITLERLLKA